MQEEEKEPTTKKSDILEVWVDNTVAFLKKSSSLAGLFLTFLVFVIQCARDWQKKEDSVASNDLQSKISTLESRNNALQNKLQNTEDEFKIRDEHYKYDYDRIKDSLEKCRKK